MHAVIITFCYIVYNADELHLGGRLVNDVWEWMDGTSIPLGPPMWANFEPNNHSGDEYCLILLNNRKFYDITCDFAAHYICEMITNQ